ncbi:MAG: hypothetical protein KGK03_04025 [Candidatus Omnitrophica bacterium]|nr:hypothetical protein [Candidatus Omnitrophota bacterium]
MSGHVKKVLAAGLLLLLSLPGLSYADWSVGIGVGNPDYHRDHDRDRWHEWHEHPRWGYRERYLPPDCYTIWSDGIRYHYCGGVYYTYASGDYMLVNPPAGAFVNAIPPDFHPVVINGITYYTDQGIYYVLTARGYQVVAPPVVEQPQVLTPPPAPPTSYGQDSFTVNVPNNSGGYTTVVVKRSGKGYVGPQGEYYAEFPKVSELKAMYVK